VASLPGFAHHGSSAYDFTKLITAKATVTSLEWGNPHCILKFETKDETGAVIPGSLEMYNPLWMARAGWSKETLRRATKSRSLSIRQKMEAGTGISASLNARFFSTANR
jgi:hypothetical protein